MRRGDEVKNQMQQFYDAKNYYDAGRKNRFIRDRSGLPAMGAGADYHLATFGEWMRMIETSRDIDRNDPVIGQGITRLVDNLIQEGFRCCLNAGRTSPAILLSVTFSKRKHSPPLPGSLCVQPS